METDRVDVSGTYSAAACVCRGSVVADGGSPPVGVVADCRTDASGGAFTG